MSLNLDKSTWQPVKFGDVVKNVNETVKDPESAGIDRVVAMEHLDPGELGISRWGSVQDGTTFTRRVTPGQTLFGKRRAYQRKAAYADFGAICSGDILTFQAKDGVLLPEFLPFIVQSEPFYQRAILTSAGSLSPRTNWSDLAKYEFDLPPLDTQKRLADLLWAVERHRKNLDGVTETVIRAFEAKVKRNFDAMPRVPLQSVVSLKHGHPVASSLYGTGVFPLLRPGDMMPDGSVKWSESSVRISALFVQQFSSWTLQPGDLVMNMTAQSLVDRFLGRVCRITDSCFLNQRIGKLIVSDDVDAAFVFEALRSSEFTAWVGRNCEGSKVKHMHWRHIKDYPLPYGDSASRATVMTLRSLTREALDSADKEGHQLGDLRNGLFAEILGG